MDDREKKLHDIVLKINEVVETSGVAMSDFAAIICMYFGSLNDSSLGFIAQELHTVRKLRKKNKKKRKD